MGAVQAGTAGTFGEQVAGEIPPDAITREILQRLWDTSAFLGFWQNSSLSARIRGYLGGHILPVFQGVMPVGVSVGEPTAASGVLLMGEKMFPGIQDPRQYVEKLRHRTNAQRRGIAARTVPWCPISAH